MIKTTICNSINCADIEILFSPTYQAFYKKYTSQDHSITFIALWLLGLASSPEERAYVPEVLNEMDSDFSSRKSRESGFTFKSKVKATFLFFAKVKKEDFFKESESPSFQRTQAAYEFGRFIVHRISSVYFHGTHVCNLESICKHGLSVDHVHDDPQIDRLNRIAIEALNNQKVFGYRYANCVKEQEGKKKKYVFVSAFTDGAYHYAQEGPEWVSYFIREGYVARDKECANQCFERKLEKWQRIDNPDINRPLSSEEAADFRDCFEKTWEHYKESKPVIFVVQAPPITDNQWWLDQRIKDLAHVASPIERIKKAVKKVIIQHFSIGDYKLDKSIEPSKVKPYFVPVW